MSQSVRSKLRTYTQGLTGHTNAAKRESLRRNIVDSTSLIHYSYLSMVNLMDQLIGNVTQQLKDRGLWNNTIMVFTSDSEWIDG